MDETPPPEGEEELIGEIVGDIRAFDFSRLGVLIRLLTLRRELGPLKAELELAKQRIRDNENLMVQPRHNDDKSAQDNFLRIIAEARGAVAAHVWQIQANIDRRQQIVDWEHPPEPPEYQYTLDEGRKPPKAYVDAMRGYPVLWPRLMR
jgi:hypothetical protein